MPSLNNIDQVKCFYFPEGVEMKFTKYVSFTELEMFLVFFLKLDLIAKPNALLSMTITIPVSVVIIGKG